jgi:hypothetical protein
MVSLITTSLIGTKLQMKGGNGRKKNTTANKNYMSIAVGGRPSAVI